MCVIISSCRLESHSIAVLPLLLINYIRWTKLIIWMRDGRTLYVTTNVTAKRCNINPFCYSATRHADVIGHHFEVMSRFSLTWNSPFCTLFTVCINLKIGTWPRFLVEHHTHYVISESWQIRNIGTCTGCSKIISNVDRCCLIYVNECSHQHLSAEKVFEHL